MGKLTLSSYKYNTYEETFNTGFLKWETILQHKLVIHEVKMFFILLCFFKDFIYSFTRDTERKAETQAEGEAGSSQGARCGTWSPDSGSHPEPKADTQPLSHPGIP